MTPPYRMNIPSTGRSSRSIGAAAVLMHRTTTPTKSPTATIPSGSVSLRRRLRTLCRAPRCTRRLGGMGPPRALRRGLHRPGLRPYAQPPSAQAPPVRSPLPARRPCTHARHGHRPRRVAIKSLRRARAQHSARLPRPSERPSIARTRPRSPSGSWLATGTSTAKVSVQRATRV